MAGVIAKPLFAVPDYLSGLLVDYVLVVKVVRTIDYAVYRAPPFGLLMKIISDCALIRRLAVAVFLSANSELETLAKP
jgi:hypothetical protein